MAIEKRFGEGFSQATAVPQRSPVKLSVAMITYNHERFLRQALESVLAQRVNFDYEIVIGEDCSTDETRAILMDFYRRYPHRIVPLLRDRNVGAMRNFQETLNRCRGTYLALLEGDDYWTCEDKVQKQVDFLETNPDYAICAHPAQILEQDSLAVIGQMPGRVKAAYTIEDLIAVDFIPTCAAMYRWNLVRRIPDWFLDLDVGDWPLHIVAAQHGKIKMMDEVMGVYRRHQGGVWTSKDQIAQIECGVRLLRQLDRRLNFQYARPISSALVTLSTALASLHFELAAIQRRNGNRAATLSNLIACVRAGRTRVPGTFVKWASLLGYGVLGVKRLRWWKDFDPNAA